MHERDVYIAAVEIEDPTARREYLDSACAGNPALRVRVERLLDREAVVGDFLEQPAADLLSDPSVGEIKPVPVTGDSSTHVGGDDDADRNALLVIPAPASSTDSGSPASHGTATGTLFGRYQVERVLGSGGMGVVYLAEDLRLGRRVALKIPKFDADGRFQLIERFRREARTMASVLHRNLCPIFDVDELAGTHYLTMAFIDGESLAQVVKRGVSFSSRQIAELIRKLALALDAAHRAGIIHRDLKPANVMIDRQGEPILMDFGLAWMAIEADARVTQSGAIVGTPAYMSPEQAAGNPDKVGVASDIYSLGAILYELLTSRPIYTGSMTRVLYKLVHEAPTRPSEIRGVVDPKLEAICWKAISRRPEDRFATAAEFAEVLARFIEVRPWEGEAPAEPRTGEKRAAERHGSEGASLSKNPFVHSDRTNVLPSDANAETIVYQSSGSSGSRGKLRIVLGSLLLFGVLGAAWAILARWTTTPSEDIVKDRHLPVSSGQEVGGAKWVQTEVKRPPAFELSEILNSPNWEWSVPENLGPMVNTDGEESRPHFSADGRRLWFQRGQLSSIHRAWISDRESPDKPWLPAKSVGSAFEFNGPMSDMFVSRDELTWIFVTWDAQTPQRLFESTRTSRQAEWSHPKLISAAGSPAQFPVLTDDGLTLYFTNGQQGDGIYAMSRPQTTAPWPEPIRLESPLNSVKGVRASWVSTDGLVLVFHSVEGNRPKQFDLWLTTRPSTKEPWQAPVSFGPIINSSANETGACLSDDGRELVFASDRPGGSGEFDMYVSRRVAVRALDGPATPPKFEFAAELPSVTHAAGLKLGDFDGDGDLDLFAAQVNAPSLMLRNDGQGSFTDSGQQFGDNASFAVALGDLDDDGDLDAFVCNSDGQVDAIWLNDGRGAFQRSPQSFPPSSSNDVALTDVDRDKDLDAVVSSWQGFVKVWRNDGAGNFTESQTIPRIGNTGIALGDLDNDGDADLVMTSIRSDNHVWLNDSQGHFADSEQRIELADSTSVTLGDLDHDGDLDLLITGHQGSQAWFNDGHGRFQASEQLLGNGRCEAVELVDLDADRDLDAVLIGGGWTASQPRFTWQNDGQGRFQTGPALATGNSQSLVSGDLDNDGDADVVFGNISISAFAGDSSHPAEVWLNQSNQSTIP